MYPRNKCYFCDSKLINGCMNTECYSKYHYWVGSDYISFEIGEYFFKFYDGMSLKYSMVIGDSNNKYLFNDHWEITLDNYLKQVERAKNLQVLQ